MYARKTSSESELAVLIVDIAINPLLLPVLSQFIRILGKVHCFQLMGTSSLSFNLWFQKLIAYNY